MTEAKLFLQRIKIYDSKINEKLEELARWKSMVTKITSTITDSAGGGSGSKDKLGDTVAKIVDLESELNHDIDLMIQSKSEIGEMMNQIDNSDYFQILHKRYFQFKTWEKIACEMNCSYQWVCKLHGRALQDFEKIMKKKKC